MTRRNSWRAGFTVTEMLVVIAIIGIMMALLLPAVQYVRESGRKTSCANNLTNIGKAMTLHEVHWQNFPTAGLNWTTPRSKAPVPPLGNGDPLAGNHQNWGWAYQILPFMEQEKAYMNSSDAAVAALIVPNYFCPSRRRPQARDGIECGLPAGQRGGLDYAGNGGVEGPGTSQRPAVFPNFPEAWIQNGTVIPCGVNVAGDLRPNHIGRGDLPDGASYTLLIGERNFNRQRLADSSQQDENNGFVAGYSWDTIRWGYNVPAKDREDMSDFDTRFGSSHSLIAQFVLCDGAVKQIPYTIDIHVFQGLCHRSDKQSPQID